MADPRYSRSKNRRARPVFKCPSCELGTFDIEELKSHIKTHDIGKPFACSSCGLGYNSYAGLQEHLHWHAMGILNKLSVSVPGILESPPVGSAIVKNVESEEGDGISTAVKRSSGNSTVEKTSADNSTEKKTSGNTSSVKKIIGDTSTVEKTAGNTSTVKKTPGKICTVKKTGGNSSIVEKLDKTAGNTSTVKKTAGNTSTVKKTAGNTSTVKKTAGKSCTIKKTVGNTSTVKKVSCNDATQPASSATGENGCNAIPTTPLVTSNNPTSTTLTEGAKNPVAHSRDLEGASSSPPSDSAPTASEATQNSEPIEPLYFRVTFDSINLVKIATDETEEKEKELIPVGAKKMPFNTVHGLKRYPCSICGKKYGKFSCLQKHIVRHRTEGELLCEICCKTFKSKERLLVHYESHQEKGDWRKECEKCGTVLRNPTSYKAHMRRMHSETKANAEQRFLCDVCGYRSKDSMYHEMHIKLHSGVKPYQCKVCFKSFARSDYLTRHMPTHMEEKPFKCSKCGKGFGRKQYLDKHLVKAICEKPGYMEALAKRNSKKAKTDASNSDSQSAISELPNNSNNATEPSVASTTKTVASKKHPHKKDVTETSPNNITEELTVTSKDTTVPTKLKSRKRPSNSKSGKQSNSSKKAKPIPPTEQKDSEMLSLDQYPTVIPEESQVLDNVTERLQTAESELLKNGTEEEGQESSEILENGTEAEGHMEADLLETAMRDSEIMDFDLQADSVLENNLPSSQEESEILEFFLGIKNLDDV